MGAIIRQELTRLARRRSHYAIRAVLALITPFGDYLGYLTDAGSAARKRRHVRSLAMIRCCGRKATQPASAVKGRSGSGLHSFSG